MAYMTFSFTFTLCPGGTDENSPAFQRWVCGARRISPVGTAEARVLGRPSGTSGCSDVALHAAERTLHAASLNRNLCAPSVF